MWERQKYFSRSKTILPMVFVQLANGPHHPHDFSNKAEETSRLIVAKPARAGRDSAVHAYGRTSLKHSSKQSNMVVNTYLG